MPTLIAVAFIDKTNEPFVWYCSDCRGVFALERMTSNATLSEIQNVDFDFQIHCKNEHPELSVMASENREPNRRLTLVTREDRIPRGTLDAPHVNS
jgi:Leu/Phe-tRNA-protein transferase